MIPARFPVRLAGLRVILYHDIADRPAPLVEGLHVTTSAALFEAHLRRLERHYDFVDLDCILSGQMPRRPLLVTFDDGYRSVLDVALPVLRRLGLPSVFFVSAAFLDPAALTLDNLLCHLTQTVGYPTLSKAVGVQPVPASSIAGLLSVVATMPYERRVRLGANLAERFEIDQAAVRADSGLFMDAADLAGLGAFGCEVANHTRSHLFCRAIDSGRAASEQIVEHRQLLEQWSGRSVRAFSYPYGDRRDATSFVERALRESGHEAVFLADSRPNLARCSGPEWNRVSLDERRTWRVRAELEVLPPLRLVRDRLRSAAAGAGSSGARS